MSAPRRLLIVSANAAIGGTERVILTLAGTLSRQGIETDVVFPEDVGTAELLEWFRQSGVHARSAAAARVLSQSRSLAGMLAFRHLVRVSRASVVNLHYGGNYISVKDVLSTRLAGKRCVVQVHHAEEIAEPHKRRTTVAAARLATALVVTTPVMRDLLVRTGVPAAKIRLIPCGVPPPASHPTRGEARSALGLPDHAFVVGSLARLVPSKGMATLIEAVAGLPGQPADVRLVIAGDGPERERLQALGRAALGDRCRFLGRVARPEQLYAASDLFALASHEEGLGLVFIEAAQHGVPSVATDVGGVRHAVRHGEAGLLVPPGDVAAFTAGIDRLRADAGLRQRLGGAARARALSEFSADAMAAQYASVLGLGLRKEVAGSGATR